MDKIVHKLDNGGLKVTLSREIYKKEAVMAASYKFTGLCTVLIKPSTDEGLEVIFEPGVGEIGAPDLGALDDGALQIGALHLGAGQTRTRQVRVAQVGNSQVPTRHWFGPLPLSIV